MAIRALSDGPGIPPRLPEEPYTVPSKFFFEDRLLRSCHITHAALEYVSASFIVTCKKRPSQWARKRERCKRWTLEARHKACFHCALAALIQDPFTAA